MKNLLFTFTLLITLIGNFAVAQSVNDSDRRQIERELERQIAADTNETVRVRITTAESYSISNRESGVRGQALLTGQRNTQSGRNDISYNVVIDTRRDRITRANWSYGRDADGRNDRDRNNNTSVLRSGRYEIQVISTRRLLIADNNGQVVQTNSGNARNRQWDIEEAGNGYYYLRSADTGEMMTVSGKGDSGASIVLAQQGRGNRDAQMWDIRTESDNRYYFLAPTGRAMDAPDNMRYDGAGMQIFKRNSGDNQRFYLRWVSDIRRDDYGNRGGNRGDRGQDRNDRTPRSGSLSWRGRVDDVIELEIRGDQLRERVISGQRVGDVSSRFNSNMPRRGVNVNVEKLRGRGNVDVVEQPSSRNNFTAIIRIRDTKGGADDYEIEVYWE